MQIPQWGQMGVVLLLLLVQSGPAMAEEGNGHLFWFHANEEYRGRTAVGQRDDAPAGDLLGVNSPDDSDNDLRLLLQGGYGSPGGSFSANFSGGLWWDLDGATERGDLATFGSMRDEHDLTLNVYSLWGQYDAAGTAAGKALRYVKAGRQTTALGLPVTFDGLHAQFKGGAPNLEFFVLGGRTAHFYELDDELFEDWIASVGGIWRILPELQLTLDYRFQLEANQETSDDAVMDNSYGLEARYRVSPYLAFSAYGRGLDDTFSHVGAAGRIASQEAKIGLDLRIDSQTVKLTEVTQGLDPYFAILGPSLPYVRWSADAWKEIPTKVGLFGVHGGWQGKVIVEGEDQAFNRNFGKLYVMGTVQDLMVAGLYANFITELHFAGLSPTDAVNEGSVAVGGAAGWKNRVVRAEGGSFFSRYKYRYYVDLEEAANVRTVYAETSVKIQDWLSARLRYEFERFDWDIHTVVLSFSQRY
jgi:hypothetical protein